MISFDLLYVDILQFCNDFSIAIKGAGQQQERFLESAYLARHRAAVSGLEAEAVMLLIGRAELGELQIIASEVLDAEISAMPDSKRLSDVEELMGCCAGHVRVNPAVKQRAMIIADLGFRIGDALHIACAERARAAVLLTTDDQLLRRARRMASKIGVAIMNPVAYPAKGI